MKTRSILERLKLIDHLTLEIPRDKQEFVNRLRNTVDKGDTGVFSSVFEALRSSKKEYKGQVTPDSFKLRRRRKFFDTNMTFATAEGSFSQKDNLLVIESTIIGFRKVYLRSYALAYYTLYHFSQRHDVWHSIPCHEERSFTVKIRPRKGVLLSDKSLIRCDIILSSCSEIAG
jgi:hypothetical protein